MIIILLLRADIVNDLYSMGACFSTPCENAKISRDLFAIIGDESTKEEDRWGCFTQEMLMKMKADARDEAFIMFVQKKIKQQDDYNSAKKVLKTKGIKWTLPIAKKQRVQ